MTIVTTYEVKNTLVNYGIALVDLAFAAAFSIVYEIKLEKLLRTWTELFYEILTNK